MLATQESERNRASGRWVLGWPRLNFGLSIPGAVIMLLPTLCPVSLRVRFEGPELTCASLLESLPLVYSSIESHKADDPFCKDVKAKLVADPAGVDKFSICKNLLFYYPKGAKRRRWVVPTLLRPVLISCFHDSLLAGHFGAFKIFHKVAMNFWWPQMRGEVFRYVRNCYLCQRGKPAPQHPGGMARRRAFRQAIREIICEFRWAAYPY